jgi:hypothetical protein
MTDAVSRNPARLRVTLLFVAFSMALLFPNLASAHLLTFSKQNVIDYTPDNPFDRLPDGRPKVPDELIERARDLSSEEVWAVLQEKGFNNQYADGFQVLRRGKTMVGRVFTAQFMPLRANVDDVAKKKRSGSPDQSDRHRHAPTRRCAGGGQSVLPRVGAKDQG